MSVKNIKFHVEHGNKAAILSALGFFESKKEAENFAGSLGKPSKMPGFTYGIPAITACKTGGKLSEVKGSVCYNCYAAKGFYRMPSVAKGQAKRLAAIQQDIEKWQMAMIRLIAESVSPDCLYFRWHDSGDVINQNHFDAIVNIARIFPHIAFWLPTKEKRYINQTNIAGSPMPDNLVIRYSAAMINSSVGLESARNSSVVILHKRDAALLGAVACSAPDTGGECADCRACWRRDVKRVAYIKH